MVESFIRVPYGASVHGTEEIEAVIEVLQTTTQMGPKVAEFEEQISNLFSKDYGVMTNSGTSALFLAIESLGLESGSEVITPVLTFSTTVGSLVKNSLVPVFVDVAESTFCIDQKQIESKITEKTKAILAPDLLGNLCKWDEIREIADRHNLLVLQDSADTLGAKLNNIDTGFYSDLSITSFYGSHIINGAGNGGMLCTNDKNVIRKSKLLRSWGRSSSLFDDSESIEKRFNVSLSGIPYDAKFVFEEIGYQLEASELSAAFGLVQLRKLQDNLLSRRKNFNRHIEFFTSLDEYFLLPEETEGSYTGWLAFPIQIREGAPFSRRDLQIFLEKRNIQTRVVFTGNILRQPGFENIKCRGLVDEFPQADLIMKNAMLIGCHHGLDENQFSHIHESINTFLGR